MKEFERFNLVADAASERYRTFTMSLSGLYEAVARNGFTGAGEKMLVGQTAQIGRSHYEAETSHVGSLAETVRIARTDALAHLSVTDSSDMTEPLYDALRASEAYLLSEFATQIKRDVAQTLERYRRFGVESAIRRRAGSNLYRPATAKGVSYWFRDRIGRQLPSHKFVRTLWRSQLVALYLDTYLYVLAEHGEKEAVVWHPDPKHGMRGQTIFLDDELDMETLRREFFHPNTDSLPRTRSWFEANR